MVQLQDRYSWNALLSDGETITVGDDLSVAVRFSLVPFPGTGLQQHDIIGIKMIRRFARGFVRGLGGGMREYIHCVVCKGFRFWARSSDGTVLITPEDYELYI